MRKSTNYKRKSSSKSKRRYKSKTTRKSKKYKRSNKHSGRKSRSGGSGSCRGKFSKSKAQGKKYAVEVMINGKPKTINFGALGYQHYKDRTPLKLYSRLNHNDPVRRSAYRARHSEIYTKSGKRAINDKGQAAYWSYHCLW